MNGLELKSVSANAIDIGTGSAIVESLGYAVDLASVCHLTSISLGNSVWGYVYLKADGTCEVNTTAPATPFKGFARSKTGYTDRRFLGAVRTDGSGNIIRFIHLPESAQFMYSGIEMPRILNNGNAQSGTSVDASAAIPPQSRVGYIRAINLNATYLLYISSNDYTAAWNCFDIVANTTNEAIGLCPCDSSQRLNYILTGAGGGAYIDVHGFVLER
jgi:hypothetical protein